MDELSLNELCLNLSDQDDEKRSQAESFVIEMIEAENIEFIEKILNELQNLDLKLEQTWFSFIIIKKYISIYEDYMKVIETSLLYFGNENEQIRKISVINFCLYTMKAINTKNDTSPIDQIISTLNSTELNIIESSIRSISTLMIEIPNTSDIFTELCNELFNFFLQNESIEIDTFLVLAINSIASHISESYFTDERVIDKLLALINIDEIREYVYLLFTTFFHYFYSSVCLKEVVSQIAEISCQYLSEGDDVDSIMRILLFWNKIAFIEINSDVVFHYVDSCGEQLIPLFLEILSTKFEDDEDDCVEEITDFSPLQVSRETIFYFCKCSPNLISPILFEFIDKSDDLESVFFIISILVKSIPNDEKIVSQIPVFLKLIFSEMTSSSNRIRYSAFYALNPIASLKYVDSDQFEPFLSIFAEEWDDIEQTVRKVFKIFTKICAKMQIEKECDFIIQVLQDIEQMPGQYISMFLYSIDKHIFKVIRNSIDNDLIIEFITFFCTFLEDVLDDLKSESVIESILIVLNTFFISELDLSSIFDDVYSLLMRAFSEYSILISPITISNLFLSDKDSSLPHLSSNVNFFISVLNDNESLSYELVVSVVSSLILLLFIDFEGEQQCINDIYECMCNILMMIAKDNENSNIKLVQLMFEFFEDILFMRKIDDEILQVLFELIRKYFSYSEIEIHKMMDDYSKFLTQILEFVIDFISETPESLTLEYSNILILVFNTINNFNYVTIEFKNKYDELSLLIDQISKADN